MNSSTVSFGSYVAAWLDSSIPDFLEACPRNDPELAFAMITCLDSEFDVASLSAHSEPLIEVAVDARLLGQGLLLPARCLWENDRYRRIFSGFDEVWFFPEIPTTPKPEGALIVGPNRISQATLSELGDWLLASSCTLGLGDGVGLNLAVKAQGLAARALGHTLQQPEPSLTVVG